MTRGTHRLIGLTLLLAGCSSSEPVEFRSVEPVCVEDAPPADAWTCDEVHVVACEDAADAIELHVELAPGACDDADLQAVDGPFLPGVHDIVIEDDASGTAACSATLEIVDEDAPHAELASPALWPPNHKMHTIDLLEDCIQDVYDCDPDWTARIIAVSSDEPDNDLGDGNTDQDIQPISDSAVSLRSERQGGSNGRVYTIEFELEDGSGNVEQEECIVSVVHDQSGRDAIDDGPAYTVTWPE